MAGPPSRVSRPLFRIKLRIDLPKHAQRILVGLTAHHRPQYTRAIGSI